jgi:hypothetical protein
MTEFYAEAGFALNAQRAAEAFAALISGEHLGQVWVIEAGAETAGAGANAVGYLVVTLGFSMEYGGRDAFVDDLFIRAGHRGRGSGPRRCRKPAPIAWIVACGRFILK